MASAVGAAPAARRSFSSLPAEEQQAVREKQRLAKERKGQLTRAAPAPPVSPPGQPHGLEGAPGSAGPGRGDYPSSITMEEYFAACPHRTFHDPQLLATEENLDHVMRLLAENAVVGRSYRGAELRIDKFQYFIFSGSRAQIWDPRFFARLAYEGFFTITTENGPFGGVEPLPELQPFYGVVDWENFHRSKHVRKALRKLGQGLPDRSDPGGMSSASTAATLAGPGARPHAGDDAEGVCGPHGYHMYVSTDLDGTFKALDRYQRRQHGTNWMTAQYFETMKKASNDPHINFTLHTIELYDGPIVPPGSSAATARPRLIAGEIGFSIGRIYTSMSGFYEVAGSGTVQLVLLGRWLEQRGYAFWSLGHCYSPQMEYKRQLGHRIYPRTDFLRRLREKRGSFVLPQARSATDFAALENGAECDLPSLLR